MALREKLRQTFGHRWMPFFLPIVASLLYVLLAEIFIPVSFSGSANDDDADKTGEPAASAIQPGPASARTIQRRARGGPRSPIGPVAAPPPPQAVPAPPPVAPPPAEEASPDGNDD